MSGPVTRAATAMPEAFVGAARALEGSPIDPARLPDIGMPLPKAAVRYADLGWPVLQLVERGKVPVGARGLLDATTDVGAVAEAWGRRPNANIGVRIPAGLLVVDVDGPTGVESIRSLGTLPRTLTAATARGWHLWFTAPADVQLRQLAGVVPGVDTRTERGYVVAPPSLHATGVVYEWARRMAPRALPESLVELVRVRSSAREPFAPATGPAGRHRAARYALAALLGEAKALAATGEGGRNHRLWAAWARCTRDADVAPFLPQGLVRVELTRAARASGLDDAEIGRTLRGERT